MEVGWPRKRCTWEIISEGHNLIGVKRKGVITQFAGVSLDITNRCLLLLHCHVPLKPIG